MVKLKDLFWRYSFR